MPLPTLDLDEAPDLPTLELPKTAPSRLPTLDLAPSDEPTLDEVSLPRRVAATGVRVATPIVGAGLGTLVTPGVGTVVGGAGGGVLGEEIAARIEGRDTATWGERAAGATLGAIPVLGIGGKVARALGGTRRARALGYGVEGLSMTATDTALREGRLPTPLEAAVGTGTGSIIGAATRGRRSAAQIAQESIDRVPSAPPDATLDAETAQGFFKRVRGAAGDIPSAGAAPTSRVDSLANETVDRLFPAMDDVSKESLKDTITAHRDLLDRQTRGVQSNERTEALAREITADFERALPKGTASNAEQIAFVRDSVGGLHEKVLDLAAQVRVEPTNRTLQLQLKDTHLRYLNALATFAGQRAEAGRSLQEFRRTSQALRTPHDLKILQEAQRVGVPAEDIADALLKVGDDPAKQLNLLRDLGKLDIGFNKETAQWMYYTNILSGPKTHQRNIVSTAISTALRPVATIPAALTDAARARATGAERKAFLSEAPVQVLHGIKSIPEAFGAAWHMFRTGVSRREVEAFALRSELGSARELRSKTLERLIGKEPAGIATNFVSRALGSQDEFFRTIAYSMELNSGAFARARVEGMHQGLSGQGLRDFVAQRTADLLHDPSVIEQARQVAARSVFQEDSSAFVRTLMDLREKDPTGVVLRVVVPFLKTPANVFRQGVQFSPVGFLTKAGRESGRVGAQARGEAALGSLAMGTMSWLAATDHLTGQAPQDPAERDAWYATGKRPNSIRIGNRWVNYQIAGPLALPLAVVANAVESYRRGAEEGQALDQIVTTAAGRIGQAVLDQSFLEGLGDLFQAVSDPARYGEQFIANRIGGFVPLSGLQRNLTEVVDPTVRQPQGIAERIQAAIPGQSDTVPPRRDAFGEPIQRPLSGVAALFEATIGVPADVAPDVIRDELTRLDTPQRPTKAPKDLRVGSRTFLLAREEGDAVVEAKGRVRRTLLERAVSSEAYQQTTEENRKRLIARVRTQAGNIVSTMAKGAKVRGETLTADALIPPALQSGYTPPDVPGVAYPSPAFDDAPRTGPRPIAATYALQEDTGMADFDRALQFVLQREGGLSDHPADRGGLTNFGITNATYGDWRRREGLPPQSVRQITAEEAERIYRDDYWIASGADQLPDALGVAVFDAAVNHGVGEARRLLRESGGDLEQFLALRDQFYDDIVMRRPSQRVFRRGWANRMAALRREVGLDATTHA